MKLNKTIIISDILSILIAFWLFAWIFIEMKCVAIIYDRIIDNQFVTNFHPVQNISLNRGQCEEKNKYSLINYTFPGIQESCYFQSNDSVEPFECSSEGVTIEEIPEKNFTIWRDRIMCASYFEYDENSYKIINYTNDCGDSNEYKNCGGINIKIINDTHYTYLKKLCVKQSIECPLNFIAITDDISQYNNDNYTKLLFDNDYYLVTSNKNISGGILTKISIAEGKLPCYERGKYSNETVQFPTINKKEDFNCNCSRSNNSVETDKDIEEGYDIRSISFDHLPKNRVLTDNDYDYAYSHLPSNISDWKVSDFNYSIFSLFYQSSFTVIEDCQNFDTYETNVTKLRKIQIFRVIFALAHILIYVLLFSILGLIKVILAWRHSLLFGIKIGISFVIFGINYGYIYVSKKCLYQLKDFRENLKSCLDKVSLAILDNHDIEDIREDSKKLYFYEELVWYIYAFFNLIEACRLVHKIYIRCKNTYRRNIANREIGTENLKKIFEKVRCELEKKKEK